MTIFHSQIRQLESPSAFADDRDDDIESAVEVGDAFALQVSGTLYGQVASATEPGKITINIAPFRIVMTRGDGPGEWYELTPGAATGEVITGRKVEEYP